MIRCVALFVLIVTFTAAAITWNSFNVYTQYMRYWSTHHVP